MLIASPLYRQMFIVIALDLIKPCFQLAVAREAQRLGCYKYPLRKAKGTTVAKKLTAKRQCCSDYGFICKIMVSIIFC